MLLHQRAMSIHYFLLIRARMWQKDLEFEMNMLCLHICLHLGHSIITQKMRMLYPRTIGLGCPRITIDSSQRVVF